MGEIPPKPTGNNAEENISLEKRSERRVEFLRENVKGIPKEQLEKYLNGFSPELMAARTELDYVLELIDEGLCFRGLTDEQMGILLGIQTIGAEEKMEDPVRAMDFRDKVANIRAIAILLEKICGKDPQNTIKDALLLGLASEFETNGLKPPNSLRFLLAEAASRLNEENGTIANEPGRTYAEMLAGAGDKLRQNYTAQGVHPKLAKKITDTKIDRLLESLENESARHRKLLARFLENYPDPRTVIDLILALKDGRLPL